MIMKKILNIKNWIFIKYKLLYRLLLYFAINTSCWKWKQKWLLSKVLSYSNNHCEYYSNLSIKAQNDIEQYPLLSKDLIKKNYNALISDEAKYIDYGVGYTGGSTGEPLKLLLCNRFDGFFQEKLWRQWGYVDGDIILAMDGTKFTEDDECKGIVGKKISETQLPYGGWCLSSIYLTNKNITKYIDFINVVKPDFIRGYPSFIYSIAQYILVNNITLDCTIKGVELTSESSYPYQHDVISKAFNCSVFLQYGHTEAIVFGYTFDSSMRYRVDPLYGYVEILDNDGRPVAVGEVGEIVVTTLYNYVMPFIRYRTGDFAEYGGCDATGIILNRIMGRTQDYIIDRAGNKKLLTALIFAQHIKAFSNITKWQIEQFDPGKIILHIVPSKNYSDTDEEEIVNLFLQVGNTESQIDYCNEIKITGRGKSLMCVQHIDD